MIACPQCLISYYVPAADFGLQPRVVQCSACGWRWTQSPELPVRGKSQGERLISAVPAEVTDSAKINDDIYKSTVDSGRGDIVEIDEGLPPDSERSISLQSVPEDCKAVASDVYLDEEPTTSIVTKRRQPYRLTISTNTGLVTIIVAAATATCLILTLILLRGPITFLSPSSMNVYQFLGLDTASPGSGLDIRNIQIAREAEEFLVTGEIANVVDGPVLLPSIRVSLYDARHNELRSLMVDQSPRTLFAGETLTIHARITDPPRKARHLRVGFVD